MKRIHYLFNPAAARVLAAGVLTATISMVSGTVVAADSTGASRIEVRIHDMHAKLGITAGQEGQWKQVAEAMRDNESALEPLVKDRKANANTMTAMDDLRSYATIADAHAAGIRRFTTAFEPLYDGMSEEQKKDADVLFRQGPRKATKAK